MELLCPSHPSSSLSLEVMPRKIYGEREADPTLKFIYYGFLISKGILITSIKNTKNT